MDRLCRGAENIKKKILKKSLTYIETFFLLLAYEVYLNRIDRIESIEYDIIDFNLPNYSINLWLVGLILLIYNAIAF